MSTEPPPPRSDSRMTPSQRTLHGYFRSSAAYRVRIALALKGLDYRHVGVHLVRDGGEQHTPEFRRLNALGLLPVWQDGDLRLSQSLAIIEYLDERCPAAPLLPADPAQRARARQFALTVACDIHPLNNPRVFAFMSARLGLDEAGKLDWILHWIETGFAALETELNELAGSDAVSRYCIGDSPTIADCCLIPQVFNARRFGVDMTRYPAITRIDAACAELPAFAAAHPSRQPDAE